MMGHVPKQRHVLPIDTSSLLVSLVLQNEQLDPTSGAWPPTRKRPSLPACTDGHQRLEGARVQPVSRATWPVITSINWRSPLSSTKAQSTGSSSYVKRSPAWPFDFFSGYTNPRLEPSHWRLGLKSLTVGHLSRSCSDCCCWGSAAAAAKQPQLSEHFRFRMLAMAALEAAKP